MGAAILAILGALFGALGIASVLDNGEGWDRKAQAAGAALFTGLSAVCFTWLAVMAS